MLYIDPYRTRYLPSHIFYLYLQSIKVEEILEDSIEKQEINDAPVDADQSSDNEVSCCNKTKSFFSNPIKSCRGQTSVKSDDQTEKSCQCCQCCQVSLY